MVKAFACGFSFVVIAIVLLQRFEDFQSGPRQASDKCAGIK